MEFMAVVGVLVDHGDVVKENAECCCSCGGNDTDISPHRVAVLVGDGERVAEDEDAHEDEAANVSESLSDLNWTRHDVEGPEDTEPDVERRVGVERFQPDRRKHDAAAFLEVVDDSEDDTEEEEPKHHRLKCDLTRRLEASANIESEDGKLHIRL
jgi:hypothetical protein